MDIGLFSLAGEIMGACTVIYLSGWAIRDGFVQNLKKEKTMMLSLLCFTIATIIFTIIYYIINIKFNYMYIIAGVVAILIDYIVRAIQEAKKRRGSNE